MGQKRRAQKLKFPFWLLQSSSRPLHLLRSRQRKQPAQRCAVPLPALLFHHHATSFCGSDAMETTAPAVTPPPAGRRCSPKLKRLHREAAALPLPLGEVTNLLPSTPAHPTTGRPRPLPSDTSATASTCAAASSSLTPVSKPSSAAATEERSLVESAFSTVYTRRSTAEKRRRRGNLPTNDKMSFHAGTASCPPIARATRTNRKTSVDQDAWPVSSSAPCRQAKKKQNTRVRTLSSGKPVLPQDFVKKQRAYFEEIDAFELPEEEASETDLE